ncbi:glycosyltransferase [Microbulbifer sp. SA54]|uniref:glycosyltransferase n=1 Tax=Microbulbifer sp. SA54 TaxID=3401577 RepID=UPI003AADC204
MGKAVNMFGFFNKGRGYDEEASIYIDKEYIEAQVGSEFSSKQAAKEYFFEKGWRDGVDPCAVFSTEFYMLENPDVKEVGLNPLDHYLKFGYRENRRPHYLFDVEYYQSKYGVMEGVNPLEHYILSDERGSPSPYFNEKFYREVNDVPAGVCGLEHFLKAGGCGKTHPLIECLTVRNELSEEEVFTPYKYFSYCGTSLFSPEYYDTSIPGARAIGLLRHYDLFGKAEGRFTDKDVFAALAEKTVDYELADYDSAIEALSDTLRKKKGIVDPQDPQFSVVIVNWNKSGMTIQCVAQILSSSEVPCEIVVVDNGSLDEEFAKLATLRGLPNLKLVRLEVNRYFGEANNIGAEETASDIVCFLNNDAFVTRGWEKPLLGAINDENYVASSPKFLFPDGRLQEAGGQINSCGQNVQFGKGLDPNNKQFNFDTDVSHASAACLFMKKQVFARLGGFDLRYEPAYYEDADLSAKLAAIGGCIRYKPESTVYHVENATSKDPRIGFDFGGLINTNRMKFVEKWGDYLRGEGTVEVPDSSSYIMESPLLDKPGAQDSIAVVFSPYDLTPGGGERYILSIAATLSEQHITYFVTPTRYSYYRLATMGAALGVNVEGIRLLEQRKLNTLPHVDVFVAMSNELSPAIRAIGRKKNIYHCQFPFPMSSWHVTHCLENVEEYDTVIVNSEFTRKNYIREAKKYSVKIPAVEVLSPPVETNKEAVEKDWSADEIQIMNVGRYIAGGHCKKQLELIEAFRCLVDRAAAAGLKQKFRLSFVGSLASSEVDREYFARLKETATGLPVDFYVNAPLSQLRELYRRAHFYWHGTGINESVDRKPELFEHFGITPVEAMSFGAIPVVWKDGGPAEVLQSFPHLRAKSISEFAGVTMEVLNNPYSLSEDVKSLAATYDSECFSNHILEALL